MNQHLTDVCFCASTMSTAPMVTERQNASCNGYGLNQHTYNAYMHYILTVSIFPTIAGLRISPLKQRVYGTAHQPSRQLPLSWSGKRDASPGKKDALFLTSIRARVRTLAAFRPCRQLRSAEAAKVWLNYCTFEPASDESMFLRFDNVDRSDDHGTAKRIL